MTWTEFAAARQLLAEERVGRAFGELEDAEDAALAKAQRLAR